MPHFTDNQDSNFYTACFHEDYSDQKNMFSQLHFFKEPRSSSTGHDGFPALNVTGPLVVISFCKVLGMMAVVAEEVRLHDGLVGYCGHKAHARNLGIERCFAQWKIQDFKFSEGRK